MTTSWRPSHLPSSKPTTLKRCKRFLFSSFPLLSRASSDVKNEHGADTNRVGSSVCSNRIAEFPEGLPQLQRLRNLFIADNRLERLPIEFYKMTFLARLDITNNLLWSPPPEVMQRKMSFWFEYLHRLSKALATQRVHAGLNRIVGKACDALADCVAFCACSCPRDAMRWRLRGLQVSKRVP